VDWYGSQKVSGSKGYKRNRLFALITQLSCALRSNTSLGGSSHVEQQPCGAAAMWSSSQVEQQPREQKSRKLFLQCNYALIPTHITIDLLFVES